MTINILAVLKTLIALLYPYLVYKGIQAGVVWFAPMMIIGLYLYQAVNTTDAKVRFTKAGIAGVLLIGVFFYQALTAKLLPVAIQLMLMHFFGKTLTQKHAPCLIERFVRLELPEFPPGILEYCRLLTVIWTGFFAFNVVVCLLLALVAPASWWALYTGVIMFVLTGLLMIGEYIYRHFRFPELEIPDVKSSVKTMVINCKSIWQNVHSG